MSPQVILGVASFAIGVLMAAFGFSRYFGKQVKDVDAKQSLMLPRKEWEARHQTCRAELNEELHSIRETLQGKDGVLVLLGRIEGKIDAQNGG